MGNDLCGKETNKNNLACLLYVISLVWVFPMSNFILPLILWLLIKHNHKDLIMHGKNLLNFQLTLSLSSLIFWALLIFSPINSYYFLGFNFSTLCLMLMILGACGFIVKGAISAYKGNMYKLPFAYSFIK